MAQFVIPSLARKCRFKFYSGRDANCFRSIWTAAICKANYAGFAWILSGAQEKSPIAFKNVPICEIRERNQHHAHVTVCGTLTVDQQCGTHCANCVLRELY